MIKYAVQFDTDVMVAIREGVQQAPRRFRTEMGKVSRGKTVRRIIAILGREPGKPVYPLIWTSAKQRKYVMMLLRRQNRIPYLRSHKIARGWRGVLLILSDAGGIIGIENSERGVEYVQGEDQQKMHARTGWPLARKVIRDHTDELQAEAIDAWWRSVKI